MTLKITEAPRQLSTDMVETVWPGDDAVDREASDLGLWCREGGREGLVMHEGRKPTVIRWRPLGPREMDFVAAATRAGSESGYTYEAARYGIVKAEGVRLHRERRGGVTGLADRSLDLLAGERCELPYLEAIATLEVARDGERSGKPEEGLIDVSLPELLGVQILAATFRLRRSRS